MSTEKIKVTFTDTFGGEANYSWVDEYVVQAETLRQAVTKAKKQRYYTPVPRHRTSDYGDQLRIDIVGACICAFAEYLDE